MLVRGDDARRLGFANAVRPGRARRRHGGRGSATSSSSAQDGFPGLARAYGLHFAAPPTAMDLSLIYRALAEHQVDLIAGDATSGLIQAYGFAMLEDDRHYFPPYDAAPVIRSAVLLAHPEVRDALARLAGRITVADMRRMNHAVDADPRPGGRRARSPCAREFL